jgi:hypothetical protein
MSRRQVPVPIPVEEGDRRALFNDMLGKTRWDLVFSQPADPSVSIARSFHDRVRHVPAAGPVEVTLQLHVRGGREERLFFREELAKLLHARATESAHGNTSTHTIRDTQDVKALLRRAVSLDPKPRIGTYLPQHLCERVTVDYGGGQKGALGAVFAEWLRSGGLGLTGEMARLMVPAQPDNQPLADNVEALQYYVKYGKNRPERFSPAL